MAPQHHKIDLGKMGCERFLVSVVVPKDHQANGVIRAFLDEDGGAWSTYSRNRVRHSVLLTAREQDAASFQYMCEWIVVPASFPTPTAQRPDDIWSALSEMYDVSVEQGRWHAHCDFTSEGNAKLALPITLFAPGAFPFNKILGYRAALVEGDRTVWTVVIDGEDGEGGYRLSIHVSEYPLAREGSYRDIVARCVSIRDDVMIGRGDD